MHCEDPNCSEIPEKPEDYEETVAENPVPVVHEQEHADHEEITEPEEATASGATHDDDCIYCEMMHEHKVGDECVLETFGSMTGMDSFAAPPAPMPEMDEQTMYGVTLGSDYNGD